MESIPNRPGGWGRWAAWAGALATALIGMVAVAGWLLDSATMVSFVPTSIPLQFNTAICLLLCGAAIAALLLRRRTLAIGLASVVVAIAGLCALEIFERAGIDVARMWFDASGRQLQQTTMAPNTALALFLAGTSIILLGTRRWEGIGSALAACLAAGIDAFSAISVLGYTLQLSSAYQWGQKIPMSLPAAIALLACGTAILAFACGVESDHEIRFPAWLPLAVLSALATASALLFYALQLDESLTRSWTESQKISAYVDNVAILVFGLGCSVALSFALAMARKNYVRSRQLAAANKALDAEIAQRNAAREALDCERQRLHVVLDMLPAYVLLLNQDYRVPFANRFFEERFGNSAGRRCYEYLFHCDTPCENCETFKVYDLKGPHHWQWTGPDGRDYDIHDFPFTDSDGSALIMEVGIDVTERKAAEARLEQVNRALRLVSACNQVMARSASETQLVQEICNLAVEIGHYRLAWIGYAENDARKSVRPVARAGPASDYISDTMITWGDEPRGRGPTGTAIRTGTAVTCTDTETDERFLPWRQRARQFGFRSSLTVPLLRRGKAFGAVCIYAIGPGAFGDDEVELFLQLAADLAFGIDAVRTRAARGAAEAALHASEERYRCLTLATAQIVWTTDANGLVCGDMPTWRAFTGMTQKQIMDWGWLDSLHPDDRERTSQVWTAAVASRSLYETEYRIRRADGEYRHVWVRGVPVLEEDRNIREWVGTCTDITERKQAEERLARQAALLDLAPAGIFVCNLENRIVFWSRGAQELYGWSAEEAGGKITQHLLKTEFPVPVADLTEQVLRSGHWQGELVHTCRNGRRIAVASRWAVESDPQGVPTGFLEINVDITDRKRAQEELARYAEELQRSNTELQEFAFVASHDLQEPLRKITAFSERLRDRYGSAPAADAAGAGGPSRLDDIGLDFLHRMHNAASRMATLIDSLLEYSRLSTRALPFEDVDLATTFAGVLADLEQRIRESGAHVRVRPLPRVMGDPVQLRQLLQNLLANALKFHAPGVEPEVLVQCVLRDGGWEISVRDNGIGFDPAFGERIFRPFQRLHGRTEYEGSGMGLAICRKIAYRHGIDLQVDSKPGQGSTFRMFFPQTERNESCRTQYESSSPRTMTTISC